MTSHTVTADMLALDAASAGEHIWRAIELTPGGRKVLSFECAIQSISEEIACHYVRKLFHDTAMLSIRTMVDAKHRKELDHAASDSWMAYVRFLRAEGAAEEADYRADCARDERMMEGAK